MQATMRSTYNRRCAADMRKADDLVERQIGCIPANQAATRQQQPSSEGRHTAHQTHTHGSRERLQPIKVQPLNNMLYPSSTTNEHATEAHAIIPTLEQAGEWLVAHKHYCFVAGETRVPPPGDLSSSTTYTACRS